MKPAGQTVPFAIENIWFHGQAEILTYTFDELLGTKLRALYQCKKGRDLSDLWYALQASRVNPVVLLACFQRYMVEGGHAVTRAQYEENLAGKRNLHEFREDIGPLLRSDITWDFDAAMDMVLTQIIALLPGDRWRGRSNV